MDCESLNELFEMVSHPARREILFAVREESPRSAAELASWQVSVDALSEDHSRVELHHNHLPSLDEAGFIDWNRTTGTITKGPKFTDMRPLLTWIDERTEGSPDNPL